MSDILGFRFVGDFPTFFEGDNNWKSFDEDPRRSVPHVYSDLYLPPFDASKAYYDLNESYESTCNPLFMEGYELGNCYPKKCFIGSNKISDENHLSVNADFYQDLQNSMEDKTFQDIFRNSHLKQSSINLGCYRNSHRGRISPFYGERDENTINLYYINEKPRKQKKFNDLPRILRKNTYVKRSKNLNRSSSVL